jgi:hypothetical protein
MEIVYLERKLNREWDNLRGVGRKDKGYESEEENSIAGPLLLYQRKIWLNYVARVRVSLKDERKCGAITPTSRIELLRLLDLDLHFTLILITSNAMTHRIGIDVLPG